MPPGGPDGTQNAGHLENDLANKGGQSLRALLSCLRTSDWLDDAIDRRVLQGTPVHPMGAYVGRTEFCRMLPARHAHGLVLGNRVAAQSERSIAMACADEFFLAARAEPASRDDRAAPPSVKMVWLGFKSARRTSDAAIVWPNRRGMIFVL